MKPGRRLQTEVAAEKRQSIPGKGEECLGTAGEGYRKAGSCHSLGRGRRVLGAGTGRERRKTRE